MKNICKSPSAALSSSEAPRRTTTVRLRRSSSDCLASGTFSDVFGRLGI